MHDAFDEGFERSPFSVDARFVNGKDAFLTPADRTERNLPPNGDVQVLNFTDLQYRDVVHFSDRRHGGARKDPGGSPGRAGQIPRYACRMRSSAIRSSLGPDMMMRPVSMT